MLLTITKLDFIEAGGNTNDFYKEYHDGEKIHDAILNIVMERYRGFGKIMSVIPDTTSSNLMVDIR